MVNLKSFEDLGCSFTERSMEPTFVHPSQEHAKVHGILDPWHMLKLPTNFMANKFVESPEGLISWDCIKRLQKLQDNLQFNLANNLTAAHVFYKNKIMNVKLAGQTLSGGFCRCVTIFQRKGSKEFEGCSATMSFILYK